MVKYPWRVNMRLFIALTLISFNLFAAQPSVWNNLELRQSVKITQSFRLKQLQRARSYLDILQGQRFVLNDIIGLDAVNVVMFKFDYLNCPGPQMVTDMEIIPVKNTSPVVEIGAQLTENCKLEIFIETKDLMTTSFFE